MFYRVLCVVAASFFMVTSALVQAKSLSTSTESGQLSELKTQLSTSLGIEIESLRDTPVAGLLEVVSAQGLFYISSDGKHLLQGQLFGLGKNVTNLTEQSLAKVRMDGMARLKNDMIVYPAKNEKHVVTVFTDITCGYCRRLHAQMDEYNEKGITVRYLAYPRAGVQDQLGNETQAFKDLRSVWCASDPNDAMDKAKAGSNVPYRLCERHIAEQYQLGRQVNVNGTPAIMFDNGFMLPGYRQPDDLLAILESLN